MRKPTFGFFNLIKPIRQLNGQSPVLIHQIFRVGIPGVHDKQIRNRCKAPLEAEIHIQVIDLVVVLHECGKEYFIGEGDIQRGTNKNQLRTVVWHG